MNRRQTPIDRMRELADDGLEPWQIAAALGVREDAVLVALDTAAPAGGAVRAVEDAASLVGKVPDTVGPTRPMTRALAEHVAVTVCGPDDVDETGAAADLECGHRWDRGPCEYSGCTAYVSALHIARTGTSRHAHHPA